MKFLHTITSAGSAIVAFLAGPNNNSSVTAAEFSKLQLYAKYAAVAYCIREPEIGIAGSGENHHIDARLNTSVIGPKTGIGAYIFIDDSHEEVVFAISGSHNLRNFIADADFRFQKCSLTHHCKVHHGFARAWGEISDFILQAITLIRHDYPSYKITATGHSLGGAIATLGGSYLREEGLPIDIYSYGAPRVGNDHFTNFVMHQAGREFRVTHSNDVVPRLPPLALGYRHISPEFWLATSEYATAKYNINNVKICHGIANLRCNGLALGAEVRAHLFYFGKISGFFGDPLKFLNDNNEMGGEL